MFNLFSIKAPVNKETLNGILNEIITPRLEKKGFKWDNDKLWFSENKNSIRQVFKYSNMKGMQGTFTWGVCLDFVPSISANKLKYHLTDKSATLHLFERTDECSNSFEGGRIDNGVTSHWGEAETRRSIKRLFDNYEEKILDWFDSANTIEKLIQHATYQSEHGKSYSIHSPRPKYVLSFLQARFRLLDKALLNFDELKDYEGNEELQNKIRQELIKLAKQ